MIRLTNRRVVSGLILSFNDQTSERVQKVFVNNKENSSAVWAPSHAMYLRTPFNMWFQGWCLITSMVIEYGLYSWQTSMWEGSIIVPNERLIEQLEHEDGYGIELNKPSGCASDM